MPDYIKINMQMLTGKKRRQINENFNTLKERKFNLRCCTQQKCTLRTKAKYFLTKINHDQNYITKMLQYICLNDLWGKKSQSKETRKALIK